MPDIAFNWQDTLVTLTAPAFFATLFGLLFFAHDKYVSIRLTKEKRPLSVVARGADRRSLE